MFYYIDKTRSQYFPAELVKTKSDFIVRLLGTDLGK